mgnify:CR=1 FL=1
MLLCDLALSNWWSAFSCGSFHLRSRNPLICASASFIDWAENHGIHFHFSDSLRKELCSTVAAARNDYQPNLNANLLQPLDYTNLTNTVAGIEAVEVCSNCLGCEGQLSIVVGNLDCYFALKTIATEVTHHDSATHCKTFERHAGTNSVPISFVSNLSPLKALKKHHRCTASSWGYWISRFLEVS